MDSLHKVDSAISVATAHDEQQHGDEPRKVTSAHDSLTTVEHREPEVVSIYHGTTSNMSQGTSPRSENIIPPRPDAAPCDKQRGPAFTFRSPLSSIENIPSASHSQGKDENLTVDNGQPQPNLDVELTLQEAAQQAGEDGIIAIDNDEAESDLGYESDFNSTASTSLASSVRNYAFENGRRYHKFREGRYNFPNDDAEQEREELKHECVLKLCQRLHFAPIGEHPQEILDIGTGTGLWAIEFGDEFPGANVLGVDLSPIQPEWVPPNVRFMVDDVESPWLHPPNHFNYIHSRHTVMAIKDWPKLLRTALEHLQPGGWMELQEIHHYPHSINGYIDPENPIAQFWSLIEQGLATLGVDFHAAAGGKLAVLMREAGYVNVTEKILHVPIGVWPKNKVLKVVGELWRAVLLNGAQAIAMGPLTRGCKWTREEVEVFLVGVRKAYNDSCSGLYMPMHIIYGQKPEHAS